MTLFQCLILAHLLFDYPLQGDFMATRKKDNLIVLAAHAGLWGLGACVVLQRFGAYADWKMWWLILGHAAMDWYKCNRMIPAICGCAGEPYEDICGKASHGKSLMTDPLGVPLVIDQAFHLFQLWTCL